MTRTFVILLIVTVLLCLGIYVGLLFYYRFTGSLGFFHEPLYFSLLETAPFLQSLRN